MKWFKTPFDTDRSHERIMAILEAIDPAELFGQPTPPETLSAEQRSTLDETRE